MFAPVLAPKGHARKPKAFTEASELQQLLLKDARDPKLSAVDRSQVARAWKELEYLKRDIRMLPKPKPIDVLPPLKGPGGRIMRRLTDGRGRLPRPTIELQPTEAVADEPTKGVGVQADQPANQPMPDQPAITEPAKSRIVRPD